MADDAAQAWLVREKPIDMPIESQPLLDPDAPDRERLSVAAATRLGIRAVGMDAGCRSTVAIVEDKR